MRRCVLRTFLAFTAGAVVSVSLALLVQFLPARGQTQTAWLCGLSSGHWQVCSDCWGWNRRAYTLGRVAPAWAVGPVPATLRAELDAMLADLIRADPREETRELRAPAWARDPGASEPGTAWCTAACGWPFPCLRAFEVSGAARSALAFRSSAGWPRGYLPLEPWWPGLLLNTALFGAPLLLLPPGLRAVRARLRRRRQCCPACGYDLRASPASCPECGRPRAP